VEFQAAAQRIHNMLFEVPEKPFAERRAA